MQVFSEFDEKRIVRLEGAYNARDLGGFKTADGGTVRSGVVFRSDELNGLTAGDTARLDGFGIKTVVDFRSRAEIERSRGKSLAHIKKIELSIDCGDMCCVLGEVNDETGPKLMEHVNRTMVRESAGVYREFFSLLTRGANVPLLFHCTAGKDRTGFAAAMFLSSLGVSREDIFHDYLLSAAGARKKFAGLLDEMPRFTSVVVVRREYLAAAFDEIETSFGTVENYLTRGLGVDINRMREIFVA